MCGGWEALNLSDGFCMPVCEILGVVVNGELWEQPWRLEQVHHTAPCMPGVDCGPFLVVEDCGWLPRQNLGVPLTEDCTWAIIARTGCEPPAHVLAEIPKLALQVLKADPTSCAYDPDNCTLPDGVTSLSRKGMTIQFDSEKTGLPLLDKAIDKWACCESDNEAAGDPSSLIRWHTAWAGHDSTLTDWLETEGLDIVLPEPVLPPYSGMVIPDGG